MSIPAVRAVILLGGFVGPDGWVTSAPLLALKPMLERIPGVRVSIYTWDRYRVAAALIEDSAAAGQNTAIIGYSGGGSRATWIAKENPGLKIDLMVLFDPSPKWQTEKTVAPSVKRVICFYNKAPGFYAPFIGPLGGGIVTGPQVLRVDIAENHMLVQCDSSLYERTVAEVKTLAGA